MAREQLFSRTIKSTEVNALCLNIKTAEPSNIIITVAGTFKDIDKLEKAVKAQLDDDIKLATIVDTKEVEKLYGISLETIIKEGIVLDPETRKPIEE